MNPTLVQGGIKLVDLHRQYINLKAEIDSAIQNCIDQTRFIGGAPVKDFATSFADFCEVNYCAPCGNGTDALEIGLEALGIGPGDEVIVPAFTFFATVEAVKTVGATPVLCDVDPHRYTIDPKQLEKHISSKTKAIMVVHLYGQMADMDPIINCAKKHNLYVIEDAAQSHGATYNGKKAGSIGDIATFSFYPGKNLGAYGDGGAMVTNNESLHTKMTMIANHGRISKYDHEIYGRNSRMDSIQGAILSVKLKYLAEWNEKRYQVAQRYHANLKHIANIGIPKDFDDSKSVYHLYVIKVDPTKRNDIIKKLKVDGIEAGVHYPISMSKLKALEDLNIDQSQYSVSNEIMNSVLSLPVFPELTFDEVDYICEKLIGYL